MILKTIDRPEEEKVVWKCYDCGSTNGFRTVVYWTDYGDEYDVECLECYSVNTHEDGNGTPNCPDHHTYDWFCRECNKTMCRECWTWFHSPEGEPEDYICPMCDYYGDS